MKIIELTKGLETKVDDEDFKMLSKHEWYAYPHGKTFYAIRIVQSNGKSHKIRMHRVIMKAKDDDVIDHKDKNGLNNQKSNIRFCTQGQNNMNRGIQKNNKSGVPGVFFRTDTNKWRAYIRKDRKLIHLGTFTKKSEAIKVRLKALKIYHKEFAYNS